MKNLPNIFKSVTILLLLMITLSYAAVCLLYPWRELAVLEMPAWVVRLVARIPEYVYGAEKKPIVILGSSLIIAPPEGVAYEVNDANDTSWEKSITHRAIRYSEEIQKHTGENLGVEILACPAAMVSDQLCILREMLRSNNVPRLLVFTVAPRDFIDNQVGDGIDSTWVQQIFPLRSRRTLVPGDLSPQALKTCYKSHRTFIDIVRRQFGNDFKSKLSAYLPERKKDGDSKAVKPTANAALQLPPANVPKVIAAKTTAIAKAADDPFANTLRDYKQRYDPPNQRQFKVQVHAFEEMLEMAKAAKIKIMIVEMPVTADNLALLKPAQRADYQNTIADLATKYDAPLVDFNLEKLVHFDRSDFDDCVHLSIKGGKKFIPLFAEIVSKSSAFKAAFK